MSANTSCCQIRSAVEKHMQLRVSVSAKCGQVQCFLEIAASISGMQVLSRVLSSLTSLFFLYAFCAHASGSAARPDL